MKEKKRFAALVRKRGTKDPFVTSVIYAFTIDEAKNWFGENNYEVDGNVYSYNWKKTAKPVEAAKETEA